MNLKRKRDFNKMLCHKKKNIGSNIEFMYLSLKNSYSIAIKVIIPALENIPAQ